MTDDNKNEIGYRPDSQRYIQLERLAEKRGISVSVLAEELARDELARRTAPKPRRSGVVGFRRA